MLKITKQKFTTDEKKSILAMLMLGLFIVLITYLNNNEKKISPDLQYHSTINTF
jgi:hypothetical protein